MTTTKSAAPVVRDADAELEALFAAINDVILVLDAEGRYVKIAPTNPSLLYRPAAELLGKTLREVFDGAQAEQFMEYIRTALQTRTTVHFEYSLPIGGREVWFSGAISPMSRDQVVLVGRDMTERRLAERELRETLSLLNATFESTADGILVVDLAGRIVSFNRTFAELWRIPDSILEAKDSAQTLAFVLEQLADPQGFLSKIRELYARPDASSFDVLTFPYRVDEYDSDFPSKKPGKGLTEYVLRTGQPLLVTPELHAELERRGEVELIGPPSIDWVGVPLKIGDRAIGVLAAQTYAPGVRYRDTEKHVLKFVSTQVAMAIERKRTEEQLHESERKYRLLFETNPEPMFVYDFDTLRILAVNGAAVVRYGHTEPEFLQLTLRDIRPPEEQARLDEELAQRSADGAVRTGVRHWTKQGKRFDVDLIARPLEFAGRRARLVLARDVSAQRQLEEQLRQSQKMEAVGQLAGGIAHDFNNLLTAILGSTQLLLHSTPPGDPRREDAEEIRHAGLRAAELTRQLLAFSRRQVLAPKVLELNAVVANMDKMLRRLIGDDVELATALHAEAGAVNADLGQLEQVLLNLVVNARDAMPGGGRVLIETTRRLLRDELVERRHRLAPGDYVCLAVTDSGLGMDEATQAHLFEPFFTTKEVGKGTGLGLATVYGIVKQSGGYIWVYSEPGRGTTVKVYLPRVPGAAEPPLPAPEPPALRGGHETVLLVEDAAPVRTLARRSLEARGYQVN